MIGFPTSRHRTRPAAIAGALGVIVALLAAFLAPVASAGPAPLPVRIQAKTIAAGAGSTVVIGSNGRPYGTGDNANGQLTGTGDRDSLTPLSGLPARTRAIAVSVGVAHSVVLGSDGIPYGTGYNAYGQLTGTGNKSTLTPMTGLPTGTRGVAVAAGSYFSLVLGSDGVAYATGSNFSGQLTGTGDKASLTPMTGLPAGVRAVAVAAGDFHSLVLGSDGIAYAAGYNNSGQLTGTGAKTTLTPMTGLPAGVIAASIGGAAGQSYVLGSDGIAYATGNNNDGQLTGAGNKTTLTAMTGLPAGIRAVALTAGDYHSIVLGSDGTPYATGSNEYGQLTGAGDRDTLTPMTGPLSAGRIVEVAAGLVNSVVRGRDGSIYGTGFNFAGQLTGSGNKSTLTLFSGQIVSAVTAPRVTGRPLVTALLTATQGAWSPTPSSYSYTWRRDGVPIPGATKPTLRLTTRDWKHKISVRVIAGRPGMISTATTSTPVLIKTALRSTRKPIITGTPQPGRTLTATPGRWNIPPRAISYRWYRGANPIPGATRRTYQVRAADRGTRIKVTVTASNPYTTTTKASSASLTIRSR